MRRSDGSGYVLPRTEGEARRLVLQSELLREATEELLDGIGLSEGMTCLDAGCGTCDATALIASRVGASGTIYALDVDTTAAEPGAAKLRSQGYDVRLLRDDLFAGRAFPEEPYDLTFSRYLVHHLPDPVAALDELWRRTRPGGWMAVLDIDATGTRTFPVWEPYQELEGLVTDIFGKTGVDNYIGYKLPHYFERSEAGRPDGVKASSAVRTIADLAEFLALLLDMCRGKALELGLRTEQELGELADRIAEAPRYTTTYCVRPLAVGVWKRKGPRSPVSR